MKDAIRMTALLALLTMLATGCPREPEPTAEQTGGVTPAAATPTEPTGMSMPLVSLALPVGATAVELPAGLLADYPDAEISDDGTMMHVSFSENGMAYWMQAFTVPADDHDALLNYFNGALARDNMEPLTDVNAESQGGTGYFQGSWASSDGKHAVRVYNYDHDAAAAGENVPFVLFYQDRSMEPVEAAAVESTEEPVAAEDAAGGEAVEHDHDGDGAPDHGDEAHGEGG